MVWTMRTAGRIPILVYGAAAALVAAGAPVLAAAAWRTLVWRTPGDAAAVASLEELAAVAAALGLLVAGQLVVLVQRRRQVIDAAAAADAAGLEAAARRTLGGVRVAGAVGAVALLAAVAVPWAFPGRAAAAGFDWPGFGLALGLLAGPPLAAVAAPAGLVRLGGTAPADLARAMRRVNAATLVAVVALGLVLLAVTAGFAGAQSACQPGGGAALCGATNASLGAVAGLIGPAVVLPSLAVADRALRALWAIAQHAAP